MRTIFDDKTLDQLIIRAEKIDDTAKAEWGKMNLYQMMKHCIKNAELLQTKQHYNRLFIGKIFGKLALNSTLKNEKIMSKNSPTHPEFKIKENGNVGDIKLDFINALKGYKKLTTNDYKNFVHPFFGKMNYNQIGQWEYKHIDHHLRQFNA